MEPAAGMYPSHAALRIRASLARCASPAVLLLSMLLLGGCVTASFPPSSSNASFSDGLTADTIFDRCLAAHGGDLRKHPGDFNLSTDGRWFALIQRIQPLVTDSAFRIRSEERYRPSEGLYVVRHTGPSGTKQVVRKGNALVSVRYNGATETDPAKWRATAMTNDAFLMFHFGPTYFLERAEDWRRLSDAKENGRDYYRIYGILRPGFGEAAEDDVVLWIDRETSRLFRIHMSLNGFETTQGAHVDTTFLEYRDLAGYALPVRFHERVRGPLRIDAHTWWTTGLDADRGWSESDVVADQFQGAAATPTEPLEP
jgi:hypothetical protein